MGAFEANNKTILFDIWPGPRKGQRKQNERRFERGSEIQFIYTPRLEQRHWWAIFQKVVGNTEIALWDEAITDELIDFDSRFYATQRNNLLYKDGHWTFGDLFAPSPLTGFGKRKFRPNFHDEIRGDRDDFSVIICFVLVDLSIRILKDLVTLSPILLQEVALLNRRVMSSRNRIFTQFLA